MILNHFYRTRFPMVESKSESVGMFKMSVEKIIIFFWVFYDYWPARESRRSLNIALDFLHMVRESCKKFCHWVRITSVLRFIKHIFITNLQSIPHFCNFLAQSRKADKKSSLSRPRWLSWMRRPTGDQEVAGSTPAAVGNILLRRLIMKFFLRSFSPYKKGSCQFLAKECAQHWLTA